MTAEALIERFRAIGVDSTIGLAFFFRSSLILMVSHISLAPCRNELSSVNIDDSLTSTHLGGVLWIDCAGISLLFFAGVWSFSTDFSHAGLLIGSLAACSSSAGCFWLFAGVLRFPVGVSYVACSSKWRLILFNRSIFYKVYKKFKS